MKIAMLAPLIVRVPPQNYGGIERVVYDLTEGLVKDHYQVTLFASGNSQTSASLDAIHPRSLREDKKVQNPLPLLLYHSANCFEKADRFDLIHNHVGHLGLPFARLIQKPVVTTLHGIIPPDFQPLFRAYKDLPYVSISNQQRKQLPELNYVATVYNGTDTELYAFNPKPKNYLLFMGRCSPQKGPEIAIDIAETCRMKLIMALRVNPEDEDFYRQEVAPRLKKAKYVELLGAIPDRLRIKLYQNALATLFPIQWEEPFGLVMTESMSCGTPVIATKRGSVPEVILDGKTGFVCENKKAMIKAVKKISLLSRQACRQQVVENFSLQRMIKGYQEVYAKVMKANLERRKR